MENRQSLVRDLQHESYTAFRKSGVRALLRDAIEADRWDVLGSDVTAFLTKKGDSMKKWERPSDLFKGARFSHRDRLEGQDFVISRPGEEPVEVDVLKLDLSSKLLDTLTLNNRSNIMSEKPWWDKTELIISNSAIHELLVKAALSDLKAEGERLKADTRLPHQNLLQLHGAVVVKSELSKLHEETILRLRKYEAKVTADLQKDTARRRRLLKETENVVNGPLEGKASRLLREERVQRAAGQVRGASVAATILGNLMNSTPILIGEHEGVAPGVGQGILVSFLMKGLEIMENNGDGTDMMSVLKTFIDPDKRSRFEASMKSDAYTKGVDKGVNALLPYVFEYMPLGRKLNAASAMLGVSKLPKRLVKKALLRLNPYSAPPPARSGAPEPPADESAAPLLRWTADYGSEANRAAMDGAVQVAERYESTGASSLIELASPEALTTAVASFGRDFTESIKGGGGIDLADITSRLKQLVSVTQWMPLLMRSLKSGMNLLKPMTIEDAVEYLTQEVGQDMFNVTKMYRRVQAYYDTSVSGAIAGSEKPIDLIKLMRALYKVFFGSVQEFAKLQVKLKANMTELVRIASGTSPGESPFLPTVYIIQERVDGSFPKIADHFVREVYHAYTDMVPGAAKQHPSVFWENLGEFIPLAVAGRRSASGALALAKWISRKTIGMTAEAAKKFVGAAQNVTAADPRPVDGRDIFLGMGGYLFAHDGKSETGHLYDGQMLPFEAQANPFDLNGWMGMLGPFMRMAYTTGMVSVPDSVIDTLFRLYQFMSSTPNMYELVFRMGRVILEAGPGEDSARSLQAVIDRTLADMKSQQDTTGMAGTRIRGLGLGFTDDDMDENQKQLLQIAYEEASNVFTEYLTTSGEKLLDFAMRTLVKVMNPVMKRVARGQKTVLDSVEKVARYNPFYKLLGRPNRVTWERWDYLKSKIAAWDPEQDKFGPDREARVRKLLEDDGEHAIKDNGSEDEHLVKALVGKLASKSSQLPGSDLALVLVEDLFLTNGAEDNEKSIKIKEMIANLKKKMLPSGFIVQVVTRLLMERIAPAYKKEAENHLLNQWKKAFSGAGLSGGELGFDPKELQSSARGARLATVKHWTASVRAQDLPMEVWLDGRTNGQMAGLVAETGRSSLAAFENGIQVRSSLNQKPARWGPYKSQTKGMPDVFFGPDDVSLVAPVWSEKSEKGSVEIRMSRRTDYVLAMPLENGKSKVPDERGLLQVDMLRFRGATEATLFAKGWNLSRKVLIQHAQNETYKDDKYDRQRAQDKGNFLSVYPDEPTKQTLRFGRAVAFGGLDFLKMGSNGFADEVRALIDDILDSDSADKAALRIQALADRVDARGERFANERDAMKALRAELSTAVSGDLGSDRKEVEPEQYYFRMMVNMDTDEPTPFVRCVYTPTALEDFIPEYTPGATFRTGTSDKAKEESLKPGVIGSILNVATLGFFKGSPALQLTPGWLPSMAQIAFAEDFKAKPVWVRFQAAPGIPAAAIPPTTLELRIVDGGPQSSEQPTKQPTERLGVEIAATQLRQAFHCVMESMTMQLACVLEMLQPKYGLQLADFDLADFSFKYDPEAFKTFVTNLGERQKWKTIKYAGRRVVNCGYLIQLDRVRNAKIKQETTQFLNIEMVEQTFVNMMNPVNLVASALTSLDHLKRETRSPALNKSHDIVFFTNLLMTVDWKPFCMDHSQLVRRINNFRLREHAALLRGDVSKCMVVVPRESMLLGFVHPLVPSLHIDKRVAMPQSYSSVTPGALAKFLENEQKGGIDWSAPAKQAFLKESFDDARLDPAITKKVEHVPVRLGKDSLGPLVRGAGGSPLEILKFFNFPSTLDSKMRALHKGGDYWIAGGQQGQVFGATWANGSDSGVPEDLKLALKQFPMISGGQFRDQLVCRRLVPGIVDCPDTVNELMCSAIAAEKLYDTGRSMHFVKIYGGMLCASNADPLGTTIGTSTFFGNLLNGKTLSSGSLTSNTSKSVISVLLTSVMGYILPSKHGMHNLLRMALNPAAATTETEGADWLRGLRSQALIWVPILKSLSTGNLLATIAVVAAKMSTGDAVTRIETLTNAKTIGHISDRVHSIFAHPAAFEPSNMLMGFFEMLNVRGELATIPGMARAVTCLERLADMDQSLALTYHKFDAIIAGCGLTEVARKLGLPGEDKLAKYNRDTYRPPTYTPLDIIKMLVEKTEVRLMLAGLTLYALVVMLSKGSGPEEARKLDALKVSEKDAAELTDELAELARTGEKLYRSAAKSVLPFFRHMHIIVLKYGGDQVAKHMPSSATESKIVTRMRDRKYDASADARADDAVTMMLQIVGGILWNKPAGETLDATPKDKPEIRIKDYDRDPLKYDFSVFLLMEKINGTLGSINKIIHTLQSTLYKKTTRVLKDDVATTKANKLLINDIPHRDDYIKNVMFQVCAALKDFQLIKGMHNDLHADNVFLKLCDDTEYKPAGSDKAQTLKDTDVFEYNYGDIGHFRLPNMGIVAKLGDLGLSTLQLCDNATCDNGTHVTNSTDYPNKAPYVERMIKSFSENATPLSEVVDRFTTAQLTRGYRRYAPQNDLKTLMGNLYGHDEYMYNNEVVVTYVALERAKHLREYGHLRNLGLPQINTISPFPTGSQGRTLPDLPSMYFANPEYALTTVEELMMHPVFKKFMVNKGGNFDDDNFEMKFPGLLQGVMGPAGGTGGTDDAR